MSRGVLEVMRIAASYRSRGIDVSEEDVDNAIVLEDEWRYVAHRLGVTDADLGCTSLASSALDAVLTARRRAKAVAR
jgi:hypothetical protein